MNKTGLNSILFTLTFCTSSFAMAFTKPITNTPTVKCELKIEDHQQRFDKLLKNEVKFNMSDNSQAKVKMFGGSLKATYDPKTSSPIPAAILIGAPGVTQFGAQTMINFPYEKLGKVQKGFYVLVDFYNKKLLAPVVSKEAISYLHRLRVVEYSVRRVLSADKSTMDTMIKQTKVHDKLNWQYNIEYSVDLENNTVNLSCQDYKKPAFSFPFPQGQPQGFPPGEFEDFGDFGDFPGGTPIN